MVLAFRMRFDYLSRNRSENVLQFLRQHILDTKPTYYGVVRAVPTETTDGPMFALRITDKDIENPDFEPIAECLLNGRFYYFWRDHFWAVAQNRNGEPLQRLSAVQQSNKDENVFQRGDKKVIIHQIGVDCV